MSREELIEKTDKAINELVYPKYDLQKAYNYYNGIRDADQFRYLEEMYGANVPTTLRFTPLIKKHVDVLVNEYISSPLHREIFCKDADTITNITREKQLFIAQGLQKFLKNALHSYVTNFVSDKPTNDSLIEKEIQDVVEGLDSSFISNYELAAQDVITYIEQSRETDLITNISNLALDLFITGYGFYKVKRSSSGTNIKIDVTSPLNTFIDRNYESPYVKDSYRAVVRHWKTKQQILNEYGKEMTKSDIELLKQKWDSLYDNAIYYMYLAKGNNMPITNGIQAGYEVTPGYPDINRGMTKELIPVYEVEWLETDDDYVMQRYETIRIGEEIYILRGKDEKVIRSKSNPSYCHLNLNGMYLLNRSYKPYSIVLACASLQDQYDLLNFYKENLIASSGTVGDWIDYTLIPAQLGAELPERLMKWISLKKQGIAVLDTSQEGVSESPLNTIFNGYDNTVKAEAIQAIQVAIESVEQTASSITGVFRERLNRIEARDAVSNIKVGQNNSYIVTKHNTRQMDMIVCELLLDCLNLAKVVWKKGLTGVIVLGDKKQRTFTALPEYFTLTDFDIRIIDSADVARDIESIKQVIPEFVKSGGLPADIIVEALTVKNIPQLKEKIRKALEKQKKEGNQIQQYQQQIEELQKQIKDVTGELQKAQSQLQALNKEKLENDRREADMKYKIEQFKAETDRKYKTIMAEEAKKRTEVEINQLTDGNPFNDKVKQIGTR